MPTPITFHHGHKTNTNDKSFDPETGVVQYASKARFDVIDRLQQAVANTGTAFKDTGVLHLHHGFSVQPDGQDLAPDAVDMTAIDSDKNGVFDPRVDRISVTLTGDAANPASRTPQTVTYIYDPASTGFYKASTP
jgi:hypothetical protein